MAAGANYCSACGVPTAPRCTRCGIPLDPAALYCSHCGLAVAVPAMMPDAERRQLTVMFCDLVGSTALATQLDPEEMHQVIREYQKVCSDIIPIYDGFLARFIGDGVLVYFGYPRAHEDDAERAVRASLDMVAAISRLKTPAGDPLSARVGIATGTVVVGDLIGAGVSQERSVIGDAPNLADRIKALGEPGTVAIAASTRQLLGELFELRDLGRHAVKGYTTPVEAWAVVGEARSESRFEAVRSRRLTDFVNREREVDFLLDRKELAWRGEGQVVLISGEAGIGKSRLMEAIAERVAGEHHTRLRYQCSPYHGASALFPFTAPITRAAGIKSDDTPEQCLDKLEKVLGPGQTTGALTVPLFASLLSIPLGRRYAPLHLSAAQQRRQTFAALLDQLERRARQRPLLITFEDLHWADATSLEFLALAAKRVEKLPVFAILTSRPEFRPAWAEPPIGTLALSRLDRPHALAMIRSIAGDSLPDHLVATIAERTDGVPLFTEESTKAVLDAGLIDGRIEEQQVAGSLASLTVPASLRDSLMARLDRLSPVKEVAQIGAAIGRDFSFTLLRAVAETEETALKAALVQLEAAGLIASTRVGADPTYAFKHALVQEAAYESLLRSRRLVLHKRIAEAICNLFPDVAAKEPEVVAHHFTQARLSEAAIEWWQKAGEQALRRSAYVEAISHLKAAIGLAEAMPVGATRQRLLLGLQVAYGQALIAQKGYGAAETTAAFVRARELVAGIDDAVERLSVYASLWAGSWIRGELAPMLEIANALLREAESQPDTWVSVIAHRIFGTTCGFRGDFVTAKNHLEKAVLAYNRERDSHLAHRFGHDIGVAAEFYLALALWPLGEVDRAEQVAELAMQRARQSGHAPTVAFGHCYSCILETLRRDPKRAESHAEALVGFGDEHGMEWWRVNGIFFRGWARWYAGEREAGLADIRQGMALCRQFGLISAPIVFQLLAAEIEAEEGRSAEALAMFDELLDAMKLSGEYQFEAEAHRQRGNILRRRSGSDLAEAEAALLAALDMARRRTMRVYELRAAIDLAGLYGDINQRERARDVLEAALRGVAEGGRLREAEQAQQLLASFR